MSGETWQERVGRLQRRALIVGIAALAGLALGLLVDVGQFFRAYLLGFLFCLGLALGSLGLAMVHQLVGGRWGLVIRRIQQAAALTLPLVAVMFIPLLFGLRELYPWARPEVVAEDATVRFKNGYLNVPFFVLRAAVYFAVWTLWAFLLVRWSERADETGDAGARARVQRLSAAGILIYILTMTLAGIDWIMSREPHYYSTVFGFIVVVGQALAAMSLAVLMVSWLSRERPLAGLIRPIDLNDLGNLLLTMVILFAYVSFTQFLINWSGNMQEEIIWYLPRTHGGWKWVAGALIVLHFFVPFFLLLSRYNKQQARIIAGIAGLLLFMRVVDLLWMVAPSGTAGHPHGRFSWMDILAPLGLGGIWFWFFAWNLRRRPLVPRHLLGLPEAGPHGEYAPTTG